MSLPLLLALDFGGVLYWTQLVAALAVFLAFLLAIPSLFGRDNSRGLRQHLFLLPLAIWIGYTFFQSVPLPSSIVGLISPGSQTAYTQWIEPFVAADDMPSLFPITVDQYRTRHGLAMLCMLATVLWTATVVFNTRMRLTVLLSVLAASAATVAAIGIGRRLIPGFEMWSFAGDINAGFGTFINRNNAALFLNLGIGCGFGLLAWRIAALTGQDLDDPEFDFSDAFALIGDRTSLIGILAVVFCGTGLMIGGSRGGVVAAIIGLILAFGWVRQRRGFSTIFVVGLTAVLGVAVLTVPTDLSLESIERMDFQTQSNQSTILRNGRLDHWPDGWRTAMAHFPGGSGMGSYGHAYLPHQETTKGGWFKHADNLWLEWFTEQGVMSILLLIAGYAIAIYGLNLLTDSPDAIDHGIRIAGWYCLGAILISQCFDFGLIIPSCSVFVCILFAAILNRGVQQDLATPDEEKRFADQPRDKKPVNLFEKKHVMVASWVVPGLLVIPTLWSATVLRSLATDQRIARASEAEFEAVKYDVDQLDQLSKRIDERLGPVTSTDLLQVGALYRVQLARFREVEAAGPVNREQQVSFYSLTDPTTRSPADYDDNSKPLWLRNRSSADLYRPVLQDAQSQLLANPFSRTARWQFARLDFAHSDEEQAAEAVEQLILFNQADPVRLVTLGREAINQGQYELAKQSFRKAIEERWQYARTLFPDIVDTPQLTIAEVLPDDPLAFRTIADLTAREALKSDSLIRDGSVQLTRDSVDCDSCDLVKDQVRCLLNRLELDYVMGDHDQVYKTYDQIINLVPGNASVRYQYAQRLLEQGETAKARNVCRIARDRFGETDPRFDRLITEIAALELSAE
ncbi:O-antigen ligase family protein [Crateriforma conspicua]|uniref:O-antigen ligase family protein n=1 Tax=Crateriforma conspicua TaxID=2527996 RepID=UPI00118AD50D|nr:O-antigen ligase family protein [Crateriforma conspicua]QDV63686.1 O-Antigen ligase [Crateriforma conspicua]